MREAVDVGFDAVHPRAALLCQNQPPRPRTADYGKRDQPARRPRLGSSASQLSCMLRDEAPRASLRRGDPGIGLGHGCATTNTRLLPIIDGL